MKRQLLRLYKMLPTGFREFLKRSTKCLPLGLFEGGLVRIGSDRAVPGLFETWTVPYDVAHLRQAQKLAREQIRWPEKKLFVAGLNDVELDPTTGMIRVAGGKILAESGVDSRRRRIQVMKGTPGRSNGRRLSGATYATIITLFDRNYYHWLIDTLPRLCLLQAVRTAEPVTLLMPTDLSPYQVTSLQRCIPPHMSIKYIDSHEPVIVERLLMPSYIRDRLNLYVPFEQLNKIRSAILRNSDESLVGEPVRRVYVARGPARHRRVLNEEAVVDCLVRHNFRVVQPDNLSIEEQALLFRDVEWIVGPHGAGLTNMLFADHAIVLEFLSDPKITSLHFRRLAASLGHEHHYLSVKQRSKDRDMTVDIGELERFLVDRGA
jgi:capsular polysaccharide biosynthesis protein